MYFFRFVVFPAAAHPEREKLGEGLALCWIDRPTELEADAVARTEIGREAWDIVERESVETVTEADYPDPDDEMREFYDQAVTEGEVLVFVTSPRFPVYWVTAAVEQGDPVAAGVAHYFVSGDAVRDDEDDVYDPDFWAGDRAQAALDAAEKDLAEAGWVLVRVLDQRPCAASDVPGELVDFFDEAEETGSCLVVGTGEE
jgi:hypothetical protein